MMHVLDSNLYQISDSTNNYTSDVVLFIKKMGALHSSPYSERRLPRHQSG